MNYYFLGIAGTAMASLAVLLKQRGHTVWGSDQGIYPPMSDFLRDNGIEVVQGFSEANLERPFDTVVIGNALSRGNPEVEAILDRHLPFVSLPEVIRREFIDQHRNIVITGTHGKTTTTALMSWVLICAGLDPTCLIGGIARNIDSSIRIGTGKWFVIEGDEYDCAFFDKRPKFVHYFPDYLVINNLEFDHADIYPDLDSIQDVFRKLMRIVPRGGLVVANGDSPAVRPVIDPAYSRLERFGAAREADWSYRGLASAGGVKRFELFQAGTSVGQFTFPFPGEYQLQNICAVAAVAHDIGISWEVFGEALATFKGVKRRMEHWGRFRGADVYDDFAHHPGAVAVTLAAMRERFPERRLVALFEPRTNTTVRNIFQHELAVAFAAADVVMMTPVHRADRLPPGERLSLKRLAADLEDEGKTVHLLSGYDAILPALEAELVEEDLLVLLTNGSLGGVYQELRKQVSGH